jgi:hypothetical protein
MLCVDLTRRSWRSSHSGAGRDMPTHNRLHPIIGRAPMPTAQAAGPPGVAAHTGRSGGCWQGYINVYYVGSLVIDRGSMADAAVRACGGHRQRSRSGRRHLHDPSDPTLIRRLNAAATIQVFAFPLGATAG